MDINKKNISELRNEIDNLKIQIHKVSVQIDDTIRENATLKRMCDNRENEIESLMSSNREIEKKNELQLEDNKNLTVQLKQLKEERNKNENECERLNKLLDESINTLKQLEKDARHLETSNTKLDNILMQAEKDHSDVRFQLIILVG
jgi:chromosome segregation ATPase